tara:strand:- start:975 stop:1193 length:219 start_codon:yes stop_codon:yes gene_type:complete
LGPWQAKARAQAAANALLPSRSAMTLSTEGMSGLALLGLGALVAQFVVRRSKPISRIRPTQPSHAAPSSRRS